MVSLALILLPLTLLGMAIITYIICQPLPAIYLPERTITPTNSVIVFDLHGVVFAPHYRKILRLCLQHPYHTWLLVIHSFHPYILRDIYRLWRKDTTPEGYVMHMAHHYPKLTACLPFLTAVANAQLPITPTVELIQHLKKQGYTLHVLSNIGQHFFNDLAQDNRELFSYFDVIKVATLHEDYVGKPNVHMFYSYLDQHKLHGKKIVFIDNKRHNIAAAQSVGMIGILYKNTPKLHQELEELLLVF